MLGSEHWGPAASTGLVVSPCASGAFPARCHQTPVLPLRAGPSLGLSLSPGFVFFPGPAARPRSLPQPGLPLPRPINLLCLVQSPDVSSQFSVLPCSGLPR